MLSAIQNVLNDQGFQYKSFITTRAREVAVQLAGKMIIKWYLRSDLDKVFVGTIKSEGSIANCDKIRKIFHCTRQS